MSCGHWPQHWTRKGWTSDPRYPSSLKVSLCSSPFFPLVGSILHGRLFHDSLSIQPRLTSRKQQTSLEIESLKTFFQISTLSNETETHLTSNCSILHQERDQKISLLSLGFFSIYTSMCLSYFMYLLIYFRSCFGTPSKSQPSM